MANYPTPHIDAKPEDFAKTVLIPGDPLRSKFIAENFLENAKLINNVRGVQGYTGEYKGKRVSVMASGMGMPSMAIYSYELFNFFDVENIIRVGSAGGIDDNVKVRDIVFAQGACTNSNFASQFGVNGTICPIADFSLLSKSVDIANKMKLNTKVGNVLSSDIFYNDESSYLPLSQTSICNYKKMGVLATEMEAAALYLNAMRSGKRALTILTISDHIFTGESLSAQERQNSLTDMMKLSLETAISI